MTDVERVGAIRRALQFTQGALDILSSMRDERSVRDFEGSADSVDDLLQRAIAEVAGL